MRAAARAGACLCEAKNNNYYIEIIFIHQVILRRRRRRCGGGTRGGERELSLHDRRKEWYAFVGNEKEQQIRTI